MKKLSWVDKLIFVINSLIAVALLFTYLVPFISPNSFPLISLLSLTVPVLIIINLLFIVYWIIKLKKQFFLSTLILIIGFQTINSFYQLSETKILLTHDLKVMSYNVRLFNIYEWKDSEKEDVVKQVVQFIDTKSPDILCFQEFLTSNVQDFDYPYHFVKKYSSNTNSRFGQVIYSNYKIINSGSLDFQNSNNNAIYVDIVRDRDTIRVYNVHLESQHIELDKENFGEKDSDRLLKRLQNTFKKQAHQAELLANHEAKCDYKTIVCGDFNNTAFSWTYHKIKGDKNDAFVESGKGFGKTYDYLLPARIDFILTDEEFEVNNFKTYNDLEYSDHFPIVARLKIKYSPSK